MPGEIVGCFEVGVIVGASSAEEGTDIVAPDVGGVSLSLSGDDAALDGVTVDDAALDGVTVKTGLKGALI